MKVNSLANTTIISGADWIALTNHRSGTVLEYEYPDFYMYANVPLNLTSSPTDILHILYKELPALLYEGVKIIISSTRMSPGKYPANFICTEAAKIYSKHDWKLYFYDTKQAWHADILEIGTRIIFNFAKYTFYSDGKTVKRIWPIEPVYYSSKDKKFVTKFGNLTHRYRINNAQIYVAEDGLDFYPGSEFVIDDFYYTNDTLYYINDDTQLKPATYSEMLRFKQHLIDNYPLDDLMKP